jgi:hypothetical protein
MQIPSKIETFQPQKNVTGTCIYDSTEMATLKDGRDYAEIRSLVRNLGKRFNASPTLSCATRKS